MSTSEGFRALRRANPRHSETFSESVESPRRRGTPAARHRAGDDARAPTPRPLDRCHCGGCHRRRGFGCVPDGRIALRRPWRRECCRRRRAGGDRHRCLRRAVRDCCRSHHPRRRVLGRQDRSLERRRRRDCRGRAPVKAGRTGDASRRRGSLYGPDANGSWLMLGSPDAIDPGSGTTPAEYLAAVREDVGGATLRRFTLGMTGLTTSRSADGSSIYRGTVLGRHRQGNRLQGRAAHPRAPVRLCRPR